MEFETTTKANNQNQPRLKQPRKNHDNMKITYQLPRNTTGRSQMICTTSDFQTYRLSADVARSLAGFNGGYAVVLHAMPGRTFHVDADSVDLAHKAVIAAVRSERALPLTGATVTSH